MSFELYRQAICSIAADEMNGEDVEARISALAIRAKMDPANIRQEVTEAQED